MDCQCAAVVKWPGASSLMKNFACLTGSEKTERFQEQQSSGFLQRRVCDQNKVFFRRRMQMTARVPSPRLRCHRRRQIATYMAALAFLLMDGVNSPKWHFRSVALSRCKHDLSKSDERHREGMCHQPSGGGGGGAISPSRRV